MRIAPEMSLAAKLSTRSCSKLKAAIQAHTWLGAHDRTSSMSNSLLGGSCSLLGREWSKKPESLLPLPMRGVCCGLPPHWDPEPILGEPMRGVFRGETDDPMRGVFRAEAADPMRGVRSVGDSGMRLWYSEGERDESVSDGVGGSELRAEGMSIATRLLWLPAWLVE